jgi:hypothetical protein
MGLKQKNKKYGERLEGENEEGYLVTFVSPSDGLVVWIVSLKNSSCHRMIRQTETLYVEKEKRNEE